MLVLVVLTSIIIVISVPIFVYWTVVFLIRVHNSRKYLRSAARHLTDEESAYLCQQICYHYRTEIGKYLFLFAINIVELTGALSYYIKFVLENSTLTTHWHISSLVPEECTDWNNSLVEDIPFDEFGNPLFMTLEAIGNVADIFVVGLGVCLMNYLIGRIKHCHTNIMNIKRFILILSIISVLILLSSISIFISNLYKAFSLTALTIYYIMFLLEVRRFKQALIQIAIERLAQHGSNAIEMRQYRFFSYTMNSICFGFLLITFAVHIGFILHLIVSGLFFGNCYFPFNFFSEYEAILSLTENTFSNTVRILGYVSTVNQTIACIGVLFWIFPLIFVTILLFVRFVLRKIRGNSTHQFRYHMGSAYFDSASPSHGHTLHIKV